MTSKECYMKKSTEEMFAELKDRYSKEEAKELIDKMLRDFGESCRVVFYNKYVEITDSYRVRNRKIRRLISEIIARTGVTGRDYRELSAEWRVHNISYCVHFMRAHSKDVALDYDKDPRKAVRLATGIFKRLHME